MKALPSKPDLRKWMDEFGGYKKAAKHFGVPTADLRVIMGANAARGHASAREDDAKAKAKLDPLAWRRDKLVTFEEVWANAAAAERPNIVGMAALSKSMISLRGEIDRLAEIEGDEFGDMTPAEVRDYLGTLYEDYADEHLELAFLVYAERHGGRVVFVADGGKRTEFDGVDGWRDVALDG